MASRSTPRRRSRGPSKPQAHKRRGGTIANGDARGDDRRRRQWGGDRDRNMGAPPNQGRVTSDGGAAWRDRYRDQRRRADVAPMSGNGSNYRNDRRQSASPRPIPIAVNSSPVRLRTPIAVGRAEPSEVRSTARRPTRREGGGGSGKAKVHKRANASTKRGPSGQNRRQARGSGTNIYFNAMNQRRRPTPKRNTATATGSNTRTSPNTLKPIKVKASGIMTAWKMPLGGLIRYYVHKRTTDPHQAIEIADQKTAEEEIDRMYYRAGCSLEDTKAAILEALGATNGKDEWIGIGMAVERDESPADVPAEAGAADGSDPIETEAYEKAVDGKGLILRQTLRPGEGPARSAERWTTVLVPQWAVGKSYYFQVSNNSPLDLSCELFLDGEQVAFNAPLSANSTRTIRPDGARYFARHQWILNEAKVVKLGSSGKGALANDAAQVPKQVTQRYNGLRPNYGGRRLGPQDYPDPAVHGWKFTGSVQASLVEFYEKKMNDGGVVKLDFYYTTGTVKTVLDHPRSGRNQLFRNQVTPEEYLVILKNPRAHTDKGYRRKEDRPMGSATAEEEKMEDVEDEFDRVPDGMETEDANANDSEVSPETKYYARDDNYNFKTQGHQNRRDQMTKLEQSGEYMEWKEANMKEFAVIHAKFYVSMPKRMYRAPPGKTGQRKGKPVEPLAVPEQALFIDIKAAENCTLGTKYHTTGPPQSLGRSNVRMERINGLTDDKASKGDPVFEKKLYYRAENVINGKTLTSASEDEMSEDEENQANINNHEQTLAEYKIEKIEQVNQYHSDLNSSVPDEEEAEQLLRNAKNKIQLSESIKDVDESVNLFYNDLIHRQFDGSSNADSMNQ